MLTVLLEKNSFVVKRINFSESLPSRKWCKYSTHTLVSNGGGYTRQQERVSLGWKV